MPISKKDRIHREHKKAEAAGTRTPVNPNGTPVKPAKSTSICAFCRKELVCLFYLFPLLIFSSSSIFSCFSPGLSSLTSPTSTCSKETRPNIDHSERLQLTFLPFRSTAT